MGKLRRTLSVFLAAAAAVTTLCCGTVTASADSTSLKQEYDQYVRYWYDNNPSFKEWYEGSVRTGGYSGNWDNDMAFIATWRDDLMTDSEYSALKKKYPILDKDFLKTYNEYCQEWWKRMKKAFRPMFDDRKNKKGKAEWQSYMAKADTIEEYVQNWFSPMTIEELLCEKTAFPDGAAVVEGQIIDIGDVSDIQYLSPNDGMLHIGCNQYVERRIKDALGLTVNVGEYKDKTKFRKVEAPKRGDIFVTDSHYTFVEDAAKMPNGDYIVYTSDGNCAFRQDGFVCRDLMSEKLKATASYHGAYYRIVGGVNDLTFSSISDKTYTGEAIKPAVTVKDGSCKLVRGTDYTVSYKNNKKIGKATVTIKGKGKYSFTKTLSFIIRPAKTTLKAKKTDSGQKLSWKKVAGIDKYQVQYSTDGGKTYKSAGTAASGKTGMNLKLGKGKSYTFRIRSYKTVNGKKYYSKWSKAVTIK
ncbi:MAG: fibronectin type III domain-containing protein [Ruminiclostridium sp.]|nr:fibronectin type III domain-containing protein [Ruminiclostridium sp.]